MSSRLIEIQGPVDLFAITTVGTKGRLPLPKRMNFRKSSKRGGGHFQSKNLYCKIWTFKQGYLTMKLIQRGLFRLCFSTIVLIKIKTRYIFKKAVLNPPPLELFRKFIRFGRGRRPLVPLLNFG